MFLFRLSATVVLCCEGTPSGKNKSYFHIFRQPLRNYREYSNPGKSLTGLLKANGLAISLRLGGKRMTVDSIISRLTQYSSSLFSRNWERWEILTIAIVALALILLVARARRKTRINTRHIHQYTPTIGIRLAHPGARR